MRSSPTLFIALLSLMLQACSELTILVMNNHPSTVSSIKTLQLNDQGQLALEWETKAKTDQGFEIYLREVSSDDQDADFSEKVQNAAPLKSEAKTLPFKKSPRVTGQLLDRVKVNKSTFKQLLKPGKKYWLELAEVKNRQNPTPVFLLSVDFETITTASAEIVEDKIRLTWTNVAGANRYEVYSNEALTEFVRASTTNSLDILLSDFPDVRNFYVVSFRGGLRSPAVAKVVLSNSPQKITGVSSVEGTGFYKPGAVLKFEARFSAEVDVFGTATLPLRTNAGVVKANYLSGSGTDVLQFAYTVKSGDDVASLKAEALLEGNFTDSLGLNVSPRVPQSVSLGSSQILTLDSLVPSAPTSVGFAAASSNSGGTLISWANGTDSNLLQNRLKLCPTSACDNTCVAETVVVEDSKLLTNVVDGTYYACVRSEDKAGLASAYTPSFSPVVMDGIAPQILSVSSTFPNGTYYTGDVIPIQIVYDEPVFVMNSSNLGLVLETGTPDRTALYAGGTGTSTLTFEYTVQAADVAADLNYLSTAALIQGAAGRIEDAGGTGFYTLPNTGSPNSLGGSKDIVIDGTAPIVTNVTSESDSGKYGPDSEVRIKVQFNDAILVTGFPQLLLATAPNRTATFDSVQGSDIIFVYTIQAGDLAADLDYVSVSALTLNGGTIRNASGTDARLRLKSPGLAGSLSQNKDIEIDGFNQKPAISASLLTQNGFVGQALSTVNINQTSTGNDRDDDNEVLRYECYVDTVIDGAVDDSQTCSIDSMQFNANTGVFNWTPSDFAADDESRAGFEFRVRAYDTAHTFADTFFEAFIVNPFTDVFDLSDSSLYTYFYTRYGADGAYLEKKPFIVEGYVSGDNLTFGKSDLYTEGLIWDSSKNSFNFGDSFGCDGAAKNCYASDSHALPEEDFDFNDTNFTFPGNMPLYTTDAKSGSHALEFNGADQSIYLPNHYDEDFSFNFWIKTNQSLVEGACDHYGIGAGLVNMEVAGFVSDYGISLCDGFIVAGTGSAGGDTVLRSGHRVNNNEWHMITFTRKRSTGYIALYIDGAFVESGTDAQNALDAYNFVEVGKVNNGSFYAGKLDQLELWETDLSPQQIAEHYSRSGGHRGSSFINMVTDQYQTRDWTGIEWKTSLPFGKELPDYRNGAVQNETTADYPGLSSNTLMNDIAGLWHFNVAAYGQAPGGTDVFDSSGRNNHGTLAGSVVIPTNGILGGAVQFQSASVDIGLAPSLDFAASSFSTTSWFRAFLDNASEGRLIGNGGDAQANGFNLGVKDQKIVFRLGCGGGAISSCVSVETAEGFSDGRWHQVSVLVDQTSKTLRIFVDAKERALSKITGEGSCGTLNALGLDISACASLNANRSQAAAFLGAKDAGSIRFAGFMDETAVWQKVLTDAQVLELYRRGANRIGIQISTVEADLTSSPYQSHLQSNVWSVLSEIQNNTVPSTGLGEVLVESPKLNFAGLGLNTLAKAGLNVRVYFESDDRNGVCAGGTTCAPELLSMEIKGPDPYRLYSLILPIDLRGVYNLESITETSTCPGGVTYMIATDTVGKYHDGSAWVDFNGSIVNEGSTAAQLNAVLSTLPLPPGQMYLLPILHSDGFTPCVLHSLTLTGNQRH